MANTHKDELRQLSDVNQQIEVILDRIVEANSASFVSAYEASIHKLERDKIVLMEYLENVAPLKGRSEEYMEPRLRFLSTPRRTYINSSIVMRQTVLSLAFSKPLRYILDGV